MFTISKEFHFSASHVLHGLAAGHQCGRLHGHNYVVVVELSALEVDDLGFVMDYGDLGPLKTLIDDTLDHRHLNDLPQFDDQSGRNPTAEEMAVWLFAWCMTEGWPVTGIGVSETPKTWAWYRA